MSNFPLSPRNIQELKGVEGEEVGSGDGGFPAGANNLDTHTFRSQDLPFRHRRFHTHLYNFEGCFF